jgi:hypothetical protein
MCPQCMTTAAMVAVSATSGAGVLGFVVVKLRTLRRRRKAAHIAGEVNQPKLMKTKLAH